MRLILVCLTILIVGAGCSKSPDNYKNEPVPKNQPDPKDLPEFGNKAKPQTIIISGKPVVSSDDITKPIPGEEKPLVVGSKEYDEKMRFNSKQPILYAVGAGGLTNQTTFEEASGILVPPRSPPDADGVALYDEGLYIRWRTDQPRTFDFIMVLGSYLGKIQMPPPMEEMALNHDFSKQYTANSFESAKKLARDYYRIFEKADDTFDCLPKGYCTVNWGTDEQKNFIVSLPGMTMLISKDRFVMFRLMIIPQIPKGVLANNIDVLTGSFMVPNEKPVAFGDSFEDFEARWKASTPPGVVVNTTVGTNYFGRTYTGAYLSYGRTAFGRTDVEPKATDKIKALQVWGDYKELLLVGQNPIILSVFEDRTDVRVGLPTETNEVEFADHRDIPLQTNLNLPREQVKAVAEKVEAVLAAEFKKAYPGYEVNSHFTGAYQVKPIKEYTIFIIAFSKADNKGVFAQFTFEEERGNMSGVYITSLGGQYNGFENFTSFDSIVMSEFNTPIAKSTANYVELSGLKFGDLIEVTDWDLGRNEGTVTLVGSNIKERATYYDRDLETFAYSTDKAQKQEMASVFITSLNVSLGMTLVEDKGTSRIYQVNVIRSALKLGDIQGLCGGALKVTIGMSEADFRTALAAAPNCPNYKVMDTLGHNRLQSVHFPNEQIRLSFSDYEITMATIYSTAATGAQ